MHEILTKTMMPPADGLCGLLQLLEAGATAHADLWGCGRQTMLERYRCAWMIARGWARIHRPILRAPLTLRTWIRPVKHGLSRREFDLLELLMRNRGAALYRDVIFSRVWGGEPDSECLRTVDTHIARLRKKLGWTTEQLETIYRVGYRLKKE